MIGSLGSGRGWTTQRPVPKVVFDRILFFVDIAQENNAAMPLGELLRLLPAGAVESKDELGRLIEDSFGGELAVESGYVARRDRLNLIGESINAGVESERKIERVGRFVRSHPKLFSDALIVAVSGSASYGSARHGDDTDVFLVARDGHLWKTLFKVFVYLRAARLLGLHRGEGLSELCLSVVFTRRGFEELLETRDDPLSARELISLKPVLGAELLEWYLSRAKWIRKYYPRFKPESAQTPPPIEDGGDIVEAVLAFLVGGYLEFVAALRNFLFRLGGRHEHVFRVIRSKDKLIYESKRYSALREKYFVFFANEGRVD